MSTKPNVTSNALPRVDIKIEHMKRAFEKLLVKIMLCYYRSVPKCKTEWERFTFYAMLRQKSI